MGPFAQSLMWRDVEAWFDRNMPPELKSYWNWLGRRGAA